MEFTFVGIPIIFVLISIFEVSRGMWIYHTLAYSVKVGVRYASVHGINCIGSTVNSTLQNPNDCAVNMGACPTLQGTIAYVIRQAAVGLDPINDDRDLQRERQYPVRAAWTSPGAPAHVRRPYGRLTILQVSRPWTTWASPSESISRRLSTAPSPCFGPVQRP